MTSRETEGRMDAALGGVPSASFGEMLKRERELRDVSLREISQETRINVRFLEALEQDRFEQLPSGIYTRNFIRAYARHLGLSEDEMVNAYREQLVQTRSSAESSFEREAPQSSRSTTYALAVILLVAIAVASAIWLRKNAVYQLQRGGGPTMEGGTRDWAGDEAGPSTRSGSRPESPASRVAVGEGA